MGFNRRQFLMFMGATAGATALGPLGRSGEPVADLFQGSPALASSLPFEPVQGPMPVLSGGIPLSEQAQRLGQYAVRDDLVLPSGYTYDVIGAWGDTLGDSRFGYNNDYLSFVETAPGEGYLTINFEYISEATWMASYPEVIGRNLPLEDIQAAIAAAGEDGIDVAGLSESNRLKAQMLELGKEALTDVGIGVIAIRRNESGAWERIFSEGDRRISGISGLTDGRYLTATGPALAVFTKASGQGYIDDLSDNIIGTFNNCAGGTTPWGTVMSAEENFQNYVPEPVYSDGTSLPIDTKPFVVSADGFDGLGSGFGYAGNKYGWMVEVDPANPSDYGVKHTWLGRFRHEAVAVRAVADRKMAVYSGCDRRGGHLYKFVSAGTVTNPTSKANSELFADGMLYAAKFNADGTGTWIPLQADTPVAPDMPSQVAGGMITMPNRPDGGMMKIESDADMQAFAQQYGTLGDLYEGSAEEMQGAILIDAHFAANAAGATNTARPEDTDVAADGTLFIAFTSGGPGGDGGPHNDIFQGPNGETPYEHGWIMKLQESDSDPAAMTFQWVMMGLGGEPAEGGLGFSNPDNLEIDGNGHLWMVTDMSTSKHNREVPSRIEEDGSAVSQSNLRGLFGNNSVWFIPISGPHAGEALMFGYGPMECEMCGPFITQDQSTLFLAAQHPGETHGIRTSGAFETRKFAMKTTDGQPFTQERNVPLGSNWPSKQPNAAPRPAVVAVRKLDGGTLV
ncbi:MAG: alkaline phosphatase PhoX [Cyanobacteria bacterium J06607_6]